MGKDLTLSKPLSRLRRVVVVAGATEEFGNAIVRRFANQGDAVAIASRHTDMLEQMALEINGDVWPKSVGADSRGMKELISDVVQHFGRIDVLVNIVASPPPGTFLDLDDIAAPSMLTTGLSDVISASTHALRPLIRSRGCIVNISSVSGLRADGSNAGQNVLHAALLNLTRSMALDLGASHVRVNAVAPSLPAETRSRNTTLRPEDVGLYRDRTALGRIVTADDVAGPVYFLASNDASFITGAVLPVDGGLTASTGQPTLAGV